MKRLTTRSLATAEAIKNREPFKTSGNLYGDVNNSLYIYSGYLNKTESEVLRSDLMGVGIDYVVVSFSTPIAWHRKDGTWHIVAQTFSVTTSKHQGNLYLAGARYPRPRIVWQGMKGGKNQGYDVYVGASVTKIGHADTREEADAVAHYYYLNGTIPS